MPLFRYKAFDQKKRERNGDIKAPNINEAKRVLKSMRLTVTKIAPAQQGVDDGFTPIVGNFIVRDGQGQIQINLGNSSPTTKEIIVFSKQLATMINSGVTLVQALSMLAKQQRSREMAQALTKIQISIENGATFSQALSQHPKIFDALYIAMISAGEASGKLDEILKQLVKYIEKSAKVKSQVRSAMTYPTLVLVFSILVVTGLLLFVVPSFAQQFADTGRELPGLTQFVVSLSDLIAKIWYYILIGIGLGFFLFRFWIKTPNGRIIFDNFLLNAPGIGQLVKKIAVGRFCATLASMLNAGVNLIQALSICASSSGNKMIEKFIESVRVGVEKGQKISEPLSKKSIFPDMVISMVMVGEETGALDEMLQKVSDFYEEEVDVAVQTLLSMIEPLMIIFIGGLIGFIVIAMYLPIFDMAGGF